MSERNTEWLFLKASGVELDENNFGYVFAQGKANGFDNLTKLLKKMGGKPDICDLNDFTVSKTGTAMPEYLITFKEDKKTIMVVECKANEKQHESEKRNKPKSFCIDGALFYAKHLKHEYDVIALAISGKIKDKCRVNAFYWQKKTDKPVELKKVRDVILDPANYLKLVQGKKMERKFSIEEVRELSLEMHERLREIKVSVKDKPIFIAGILIALQDSSFRSDWDNLSQFDTLVKLMVGSIESMLDKSNIRKEKINAIKGSFEKIKTNEKLRGMPFGANGSLPWFIGQLESKILPMMNHYEYTEDALGVFYHEFIKYSSSDGNGLGIVLTPKHLTDFMCDLGEINKNSKVVDICCGSGSFLVTAMSKMCRNANPREVNAIKQSSLFGIELDIELFTLSITNMIVRQDGKSNIIHSDCFNANAKKELLRNFPDTQLNVGLINPPYSQGDYCELEFVEKLLSFLSPNGIAVAVVPMSCAIGTKFKSERRHLFNNHTLKAVFSMPDDIFYPVGTNVCVMVWQAHKPHDPKQKTFFGFCKEDGFIKRKKLGRVDAKNHWGNIKNEWLELYRDKKVVDGKSALQAVNHDDEWLAEAYMKTDYSALTQADFEKTVRDYLSYLVKNGDCNA
ncbi:MAG: SAM-dependent methyltransferase [Treponema sp.]|nr:SAM-dependent methyltransferase [Treponema sp.]